jgi:hypothetical protein
MSGNDPTRNGHWIEPTRTWNDTSVSYCAVCGRLIPRKSWVFEGGAGPLVACTPDCEDLYESYLKPAYGAMASHAHRKG